jgi:HK97 family phage major capsid protein
MTKEEIMKLDPEGIQERKAQIAEEINAENADLEALNAEIDALEERANGLREAAEKRAAMAKRVAQTGKPVKNIVEEEEMEQKKFSPDTVEYRDAYMKKLMGKDLSVEERTALTSAADVIPTQTMNEIYGRLADNPLYNELNIMRFPGYVQVPYEKTVNNASWVAMGTASTDSADEVDSVSLSMYKLIKTVEITADIAHASIPAFSAWLVDRLAQKMVAAICYGVLQGSGSGQATGIIPELTPEATTVTYNSILSIMAAVPAQYHRDAVFTMSAATFFNKVMTLKDKNDRPLVMQGMTGVDQAPVYTLLGHRVILEESASTNSADSILFGNYRDGYAFNFARDIEITADDSVEFRKGSRVYRGMALCDGKPVIEEAFAVIRVAKTSA